MKRKHYPVEQTVAALTQAKPGMPVADPIRRLGQAATYIAVHYDLNTQRARCLVKQASSSVYFRTVKDPHTAFCKRMREIARTRVRYGLRRVHVLLKCESWRLNRNGASTGSTLKNRSNY